jgi:hypothetical protein
MSRAGILVHFSKNTPVMSTYEGGISLIICGRGGLTTLIHCCIQSSLV